MGGRSWVLRPPFIISYNTIEPVTMSPHVMDPILLHRSSRHALSRGAESQKRCAKVRVREKVAAEASGGQSDGLSSVLYRSKRVRWR